MNSTALVTIAVQRHWLNGSISIAGHRILDVLNDSSTNFVELHKAKIVRRDMTAPVSFDQDVVIKKSSIQHLVIHNEKHETTEKRSMYSTVSKRSCDVLVLSGDCEIRGRAFFSGQPDPRRFLSGELGAFFPVKHAVILDTEYAQQPLEVPVVMLNRDRVSVLVLETESTSSGPTSADQLSQKISNLLNSS